MNILRPKETATNIIPMPNASEDKPETVTATIIPTIVTRLGSSVLNHRIPIMAPQTIIIANPGIIESSGVKRAPKGSSKNPQKPFSNCSKQRSPGSA